MAPHPVEDKDHVKLEQLNHVRSAALEHARQNYRALRNDTLGVVVRRDLVLVERRSPEPSE